MASGERIGWKEKGLGRLTGVNDDFVFIVTEGRCLIFLTEYNKYLSSNSCSYLLKWKLAMISDTIQGPKGGSTDGS